MRCMEKNIYICIYIEKAEPRCKSKSGNPLQVRVVQCCSLRSAIPQRLISGKPALACGERGREGGGEGGEERKGGVRWKAGEGKRVRGEGGRGCLDRQTYFDDT